MMNLPGNTALIVVDVQCAFDEPVYGARNNPQAETNIGRLLRAWRQNGRPIFHIQHLSTEPDSPLRPELPGSALKPVAQPQGEEPLIQKNVNNAFVGTDLEARLRGQGIDAVVVVGLTTDHCVSTTVRMAGDLGFETYIVEDATATFERTGHDGRHFPAQAMHALALASLHEEFATVVATDSLLADAPER